MTNEIKEGDTVWLAGTSHNDYNIEELAVTRIDVSTVVCATTRTIGRWAICRNKREALLKTVEDTGMIIDNKISDIEEQQRSLSYLRRAQKRLVDQLIYDEEES